MSENQKEPQYKLRWSEELRDKVVESAKQHSRSINAEICTRLEKSFDTPENTRILLEDAVKLTLQAIKNDPSLLNNSKVSSVYISDGDAEKDTVEFINKKAP